MEAIVSKYTNYHHHLHEISDENTFPTMIVTPQSYNNVSSFTLHPHLPSIGISYYCSPLDSSEERNPPEIDEHYHDQLRSNLLPYDACKD